ncbi:hypothetical protein B0O41_3960 [Propionibacteriaceae bacterium ES.041]|nr:hypothetical protein B0O41_3960 [Propionibacteriaceae bacterium ES.041]
MRNRRSRRAEPRGPKPLSRAAFQRELRKVVDGDPSADPHVKAFWDQAFASLDGKAAMSHPDGIEVLRRISRQRADQ